MSGPTSVLTVKMMGVLCGKLAVGGLEKE